MGKGKKKQQQSEGAATGSSPGTWGTIGQFGQFTVHSDPSTLALPAPRPAEAQKNLEQAESTSPLVGFRVWGLHRSYPGGLYLASLHDKSRWVPRERREARCVPIDFMSFSTVLYGGSRKPSTSNSPSPAPEVKCNCGIFAFRSKVEMGEADKVSPCIVGEVSLWGRVIEHESGYRAQYAYPKRLAVVGYPNAERIANALEMAYGVPCEVLE